MAVKLLKTKNKKEFWTLATSSFSICFSTFSFFAFYKLISEQQLDDELRTMRKAERIKSRDAKNYPLVSVLIPARNEEANIKACINLLLSQDYPNFEVVVINDNSTDQTEAVLTELTRQYPDKLRVINSTRPEGNWLGKNNALWQGYQEINPETEWLLFTDADTRLLPGTLFEAVAYARHKQVDLLSLAPRASVRNFWQRLLNSEVTKFYAMAAFNPLHPIKPGSVDEAMAVGRFILTRREAYKAVDGHRAVYNYVLEDIELARTFRAKGFATLAGLAYDHLNMEDYENLSDIWESVTKNWFLVARKRWSSVVMITLIEGLAGLVPIGTFIFKLLTNSQISKKSIGNQAGTSNQSKLAGWINGLAIILLLTVYGEQINKLGVPRRYSLLYPVSALLSLLMLLHSAYQIGVRQSVSWKGRKMKVE